MGGIGPRRTGESGAKGSHQIEGGRITGGLVGRVGQGGTRAMYNQGYFNLKKIIMLHPIDLWLPPLEGEVATGGETGTGPTRKDPTSIPIAEEIQPLSSKVIDKIELGEFVDLGDLLQDQVSQDDIVLPDPKSGVVLVQSLESLKKKKKRITDFQSWSEAFMVFVAAKFRKVQPEVAKLMAYGVLINQAAREHTPDRWLTYDLKFRELVGAKKDDTWNELNVGLWNCFFTSQTKWLSQKTCSECLEGGHNAWECTSQGEIGAKKRLVPQSGPVAKRRYCFPFNNKGACDRGGTCQFWHRCLECGGDHPQVYCEKRKRGRETGPGGEGEGTGPL